jgi:hypothetical protein
MGRVRGRKPVRRVQPRDSRGIGRGGLTDPGIRRSRGVAEGWGELGVIDPCVGCSRGTAEGLGEAESWIQASGTAEA